MTIRLHHFFVLSAPKAPQADLFLDLGLHEGSSNIHPGQGTANRRFFFSNTMLEFLYVHDAREASNERGSRLHLLDRFTEARASPFGLVVSTTGELREEPFPGWRYCPDYLPHGQCFHVGANSSLLDEPLCICMPPDLHLVEPRPQPANFLMTLTELRVSVPVTQPSRALRAMSDCEGVTVRLNEPHRLELVFNDGEKGRFKDMTPKLPIVVRW
jgi:hypothetical protein